MPRQSQGRIDPSPSPLRLRTSLGVPNVGLFRLVDPTDDDGDLFPGGAVASHHFADDCVELGGYVDHVGSCNANR